MQRSEFVKVSHWKEFHYHLWRSELGEKVLYLLFCVKDIFMQIYLLMLTDMTSTGTGAVSHVCTLNKLLLKLSFSKQMDLPDWCHQSLCPTDAELLHQVALRVDTKFQKRPRCNDCYCGWITSTAAETSIHPSYSTTASDGLNHTLVRNEEQRIEQRETLTSVTPSLGVGPNIWLAFTATSCCSYLP